MKKHPLIVTLTVLSFGFMLLGCGDKAPRIELDNATQQNPTHIKE